MLHHSNGLLSYATDRHSPSTHQARSRQVSLWGQLRDAARLLNQFRARYMIYTTSSFKGKSRAMESICCELYSSMCSRTPATSWLLTILEKERKYPWESNRCTLVPFIFRDPGKYSRGGKAVEDHPPFHDHRKPVHPVVELLAQPPCETTTPSAFKVVVVCNSDV